MAKDTDVFGFTCSTFAVPPTGAQAVLIQPAPYQVAQIIKYVSGGSLEIIGLPFGATNWAAASLSASLIGTGYLMGTSEAVPYDGAARYYLMATGATVLVTMIRGVGQGIASI